MPHIERQRLNVPQGITGLWQLSADRKYAIHESLEYDLYYMEHRGFFLDMAILMHTAVFAMKGGRRRRVGSALFGIRLFGGL